MKNLFISVLIVMSLGISSSCAKDSTTPTISEGLKLKITVGDRVFTAVIYDNATAKDFTAMLPMTVTMSEHNRNEKYYDLPSSLPTDASRPGRITNGDLMLYGSRTLVLFYKSFSSTYSYTRIGAIEDPSGLENALGSGSVTVTFELAK